MGFQELVVWPDLSNFGNIEVLHLEGNQLTAISPSINRLKNLREFFFMVCTTHILHILQSTSHTHTHSVTPGQPSQLHPCGTVLVIESRAPNAQQ